MTRKFGARAGWVLGLAAALGVGLLAGRATFAPPPVAETELPVATQTVAEATVGSSVTLPVTVRWMTHPLAAGSTSGMVTSIVLDGATEVAAGDMLFAVNLRPVIAAEGATPAFRALAQGVRGDDVAQLQSFLTEAGFFTGEASGVFGASTAAAVRNWQRSLGLERTGVVLSGDLVFIESLPARVVLAENVVVGSVVSPGQAILSMLGEAPEFTAIISSGMQQAVIPPTGATVTVDAPDGTVWEAVVIGSERDDWGGTTLFLEGPTGGPVCGVRCDLVEFTGHDIMLTGQSITVPEFTGPALPHAAVGTAADGTRFVVVEGGVRRPVTVLAADASRLIVDGVTVGEVVQLFAATDDVSHGANDD